MDMNPGEICIMQERHSRLNSGASLQGGILSPDGACSLKKNRLASFFRKNTPACDQRGFTLFELLVAVILLGMISVMIYSVLNVGIKFSDKGERALAMAVRQHGILNLLHRQIVTAYYDNVQKRVLVSGEGEVLRVVTRSPLRYRLAGVVLALYRYDPAEQVLYYSEKRDYYNSDYDEEYLPDFGNMLVLASGVPSLSFEVDEDAQTVTVVYDDEIFAIQPRCAEMPAYAMEGNLQ